MQPTKDDGDSEKQTLVDVQMKSLVMEKDIEFLKKSMEQQQRIIDQQQRKIERLSLTLSNVLLNQEFSSQQQNNNVLLRMGDTVIDDFTGEASSNNCKDWNVKNASILLDTPYCCHPLGSDKNTFVVTLTMNSRRLVKGFVIKGRRDASQFVKVADIFCSKGSGPFVCMGRFKLNVDHTSKVYIYFKVPDYYSNVRIKPIEYNGWPFFNIGIIVQE